MTRSRSDTSNPGGPGISIGYRVLHSYHLAASVVQSSCRTDRSDFQKQTQNMEKQRKQVSHQLEKYGPAHKLLLLLLFKYSQPMEQLLIDTD